MYINIICLQYVTQEEAIKLDEELFQECGFAISSGLQLMELAGNYIIML